MLILRSKTGSFIWTLIINIVLCISLAQAGTGFGRSNIFPINNIDAITVSATNNWDGTVTVEWTLSGSYELIRQQWNGEDWIDHKPFGEVSGKNKTDKYDLDDLKKNYRYALKPLCSSSIVYTSNTVKPEIIVVLVRGYDSGLISDGVDVDYWTSNTNEQSKGLVKSVHDWFESNSINITCWDASGELNGKKSIEWNSGRLDDFISQNRTGVYKDAKINLIGHSMGGLISRRYAFSNDTIIKNTFCIQTPHTGSPLADIAGWFSGEAKEDLEPDSMEIFNNKYKAINSIKIYSTFSSNHEQVLDSAKYGMAAAAIATDIRFFYDSYHAPSDGAAPKLSCMGGVRKREQINIIKKSVDVYFFWDSNLDHGSSYRHPHVLNKIMEWLDYPQQTVVSSAPVMQMQSLTENKPELTPLYFIAGFEGQFDNAHAVTKIVNVGSSQTAYFRANVSDPNCVFTITNPNAVVIDPMTAETDPNITYSKEDGIQSYEINSPISGEWTLNLTTLLSDVNSVQYGLTAFEDQQIILSAYSSSEWTNTGQSIILKADISGNAGVITGATVSGIVSLPNTTTQNIILYDDGTNGDTSANDGTYSYLFNSTSLDGRYNVDVSATGVISGGCYFERTATTSFTASKAGISINGSITDTGIDQNANGYYDILRIAVPVDVNASGKYRLTASLLDDSNDTITLINSGEIELESLPKIIAGDLDGNKKVNFIDFSMLANMWQAGTGDINDLGAMAGNWLEGTIPAAITIDVPAEEIAKHNADGPFRLVDIEIRDANSGLIITTAGDYTTSAYLLTDFELLDTDKDGLPDSLENAIGTDPNKTDSDGDGASDYQEISFDGNSASYNPLTDSNPLDIDTDKDGMTDGYEISYGLNPLIDDTLDDLDGDGLTNIQEYNLHTRPDKIDTDDDGRNDKWEIDNSTNPLVYEIYTRIAGDINLDASVDFPDLVIIANQWLRAPGIPSADIAPDGGDGIVNMLDFAVFAENWLVEQ